MRTVAALYVQTNGCYADLPGVEVWDEARDARLYAGPHPVVAHPPCDRWHQLSAVNNKRWGFKINEDGGCFASALEAVRRWGGVLEHPAESRAFRFHGIPEPVGRGWQRSLEGDWITEVDQAAYGHRARKRTWLIYSGDSPPPMLDWRVTKGTHQIGLFDQKLPQLPKAERAGTPHAFRDLLLDMARIGEHRTESSMTDHHMTEREASMTRSICERLDAIDEEAMYQAPASTYAIIQEAKRIIETQAALIEECEGVIEALVECFIRRGPFDEPLGSSEQAPSINAANATLAKLKERRNG